VTACAGTECASARAPAGSLATGAMMRTRAPSVRCSRAASSINHNLLAYSLAMVRPRPWYQYRTSARSRPFWIRTSFTSTAASGVENARRVETTGCQPAPGRQFCGEWIVSPCRWLA
jgi:hypothetical protein